MTYRIFEKECEICGKPFRRSGKPEKPPRFCGWDCMTKWRIGNTAHPKHRIEERWMPVIRKTYLEATGKGEITALAKKIGVPRQILSNVARSNGWMPKQNPDMDSYYWCDTEEKIVTRWAHASVQTIRRRLADAGYKRTVGAIEIKMAEMRARQNLKGMSANDLAGCMGVDVHNILRAINLGALKAKRRPGYTAEKTAYYIRPKEVREYIVNHLPEIDIREIDKYWLVDLLTAGDPNEL